MSDYRRVFIPGGTYFFTVVTWHRRPLLASDRRVRHLREAFAHVRTTRPFRIEAIVILPDHLHCLWTLPPNDADYPGRWREIKKRFSRRVDLATNDRNERFVWQRRYYEHTIRDQQDWRRHLDSIHYNPVKHGFVKKASEWPYSSFRTALQRGWYEESWGDSAPENLDSVELE